MTVTISGNGPISGLPLAGQCRFYCVSATQCRLIPYQGNQLTIAGVNQTVPSAGVNLANTSLSATTIYFVYAYMNGLTMTLEASTTGHSTDATTGVEIKTGDATRTLVGMVRATASSQFSNALNARFVISWFNRRSAQCSNSAASTLTTGQTTPQPLFAVEFITWGDEGLPVSFSGGVQNTVSLAVVFMAAALDSGTNAATPATYAQVPSANQYGPFTLSALIGIGPEGYHYIYALGWVNAGVGSFLTGCGMNVQISY